MGKDEGPVPLFGGRNHAEGLDVRYLPEALGIPKTGITQEEPWDVLVFRDPDNFQIEPTLLKVDPGQFTT